MAQRKYNQNTLVLGQWNAICDVCEKQCTQCGEVKSLSDFGIDNRLKSRRASACKVCKREQSRKYRDTNRELCRHRCREWRNKNILHEKSRQKEYYNKNKNKLSEKNRLYRITNSGYFAHKTQERFALKLKATPAWANEGYIKLFYKLAKIEEKRTGRKVHVDHIVPLQGERVCGLHCEDNLQLMFAEDNMEKGNKHAD